HRQRLAIFPYTTLFRSLAIKLLQFSEILDQVARDALPHLLCSYLYDIASLYMSFYEACPILKEGVAPELRDSRLRLCHLVARTLDRKSTRLNSSHVKIS